MFQRSVSRLVSKVKPCEIEKIPTWVKVGILASSLTEQNDKFSLSNWLPGGRKVETLNVSSFRAPGIPKLGTFNVPRFGFPASFPRLLIDVWTARGGSGVNLQYAYRTVGKV